MAVNMTLNFCSKPYRRIFIFNSYIFDKEQMYQIFCEITTMADGRLSDTVSELIHII